jgi:DNA repair protein RadC
MKTSTKSSPKSKISSKTYRQADSDIHFEPDLVSSYSQKSDPLNDISIDAPIPSMRAYSLKLRDLPSSDRPREKMISSGPSSLTLQELISVVLNTGTKTEDVSSIAKRVVREYGHSALVTQGDATKMSEELQIPIGKACQIIACSEIGKRLYRKNEFGLSVIRTAQDVYEYAKDMHSLPKEQLKGIYLDTHNRVIHDEIISIGTLNSNIVHPREVFRPALEYGAAAVVLAHNHPSGVPTPSDSDISITKQLIEAGKIIGIRILDHIVIAKDAFQSVDVDYD